MPSQNSPSLTFTRKERVSLGVIQAIEQIWFKNVSINTFTSTFRYLLLQFNFEIYFTRVSRIHITSIGPTAFGFCIY